MARHLNQPAPTDREVVTPKSTLEWLEDALGRYQVTHIHSSVREAIKAMSATESADARSKLAQTEEPQCACKGAGPNYYDFHSAKSCGIRSGFAPKGNKFDSLIRQDAPVSLPSPPQTEEPQSDYGNTHCSEPTCGADLGHNSPHSPSVNLPSPPRVDAAPATLTLIECPNCGNQTDNVNTDGTASCPCGWKGKYAAPAKEVELPLAEEALARIIPDAARDDGNAQGDMNSGAALFWALEKQYGADHRTTLVKMCRRYVTALRDLREARQQVADKEVVIVYACKVTAELRSQIKERDAALTLACELHGCGSEECAATKYREDGKKLIAENETVFNLKAELAALRADRDVAVEILRTVDSVATVRSVIALLTAKKES